jgi:REP element-mobilizing transposase RayT
MGQHGLPNRRSIRLRGYDYAQNNAYFVTVCLAQRLCLFGDITDGVVRSSTIGEVVASAWSDLPNHTPGLILDTWVIMPNHVHGIVILPGEPLPENLGQTILRGPKPGSLGTVVGGFKSAVSREVAVKQLSLIKPFWQRNYYERIIRNDRELDATRKYIESNPVRWDDDPDHPHLHLHGL